MKTEKVYDALRDGKINRGKEVWGSIGPSSKP